MFIVVKYPYTRYAQYSLEQVQVMVFAEDVGCYCVLLLLEDFDKHFYKQKNLRMRQSYNLIWNAY